MNTITSWSKRIHALHTTGHHLIFYASLLYHRHHHLMVRRMAPPPSPPPSPLLPREASDAAVTQWRGGGANLPSRWIERKGERSRLLPSHRLPLSHRLLPSSQTTTASYPPVRLPQPPLLPDLAEGRVPPPSHWERERWAERVVERERELREWSYNE